MDTQDFQVIEPAVHGRHIFRAKSAKGVPGTLTAAFEEAGKPQHERGVLLEITNSVAEELNQNPETQNRQWTVGQFEISRNRFPTSQALEEHYGLKLPVQKM